MAHEFGTTGKVTTTKNREFTEAVEQRATYEMNSFSRKRACTGDKVTAVSGRFEAIKRVERVDFD
jgi:hypothetical protein